MDEETLFYANQVKLLMKYIMTGNQKILLVAQIAASNRRYNIALNQIDNGRGKEIYT